MDNDTKEKKTCENCFFSLPKRMFNEYIDCHRGTWGHIGYCCSYWEPIERKLKMLDKSNKKESKNNG